MLSPRRDPLAAARPADLAPSCAGEADLVPALRSLPRSMQGLLRHRRVLLLQGPMGWFFDRLARTLAAQGQVVHKVHFNGGDRYFYRQPGALDFTGLEADWPAWLGDLITRERIDAVVVFGQMRAIHCAAREVADACGRAFYVFEEGYLRPDYVTLERDGVNAHSPLPRDPAIYRAHAPIRSDQLPQPTGQRFRTMAWVATCYSLACALGWPRFRHHCYHRQIHPAVEAARWLRGGWRRLAYAWRDRGMLGRLSSPAMSQRWFLVPLQVHNDSQVRFHSEFGSVQGFVHEVMQSFACRADPSMHLVLKHHPMDRAYSDYSALIARAARELGLGGRVHYVHDLHLPTLLRHTRGVVTINSTTGLQAMYHGAPVVALGECLYDIPGLTHQGGLDGFWAAPSPVDADLYWRFRAYLTEHTQLNASFYGRAPGLEALGEAAAVAADPSQRTAAHGVEPA
ncbi:MAG: capsular biosynthesis protein [Burkholderiales bacterium]|nr:capsular biosynthesis protein [Burkholderiales bacterium]